MIKEKEELVEIPGDILLEVEGNKVKFKFQNKESTREFKASDIKIEKSGSNLKIKTSKPRKDNYAIMKSIASHIKNIIYGLKHGYEYKLEIVYSHFPMNAAVKEGYVEISNLAGAKKPIKVKIVGDTKVEVKGKEITVRGIDKECAGQTAGNLERATRIKNKDLRVFQDGIYIVSKPKTFGAIGVEKK